MHWCKGGFKKEEAEITVTQHKSKRAKRKKTKRLN